MELSKLLKLQLKRLSIDPESLPRLPQWKEFLERVNKAYLDGEQERYLHERSMEISSREFIELNKKLEEAQHIARLGYWEVDLSNNKVFWSKELYLLHGLDSSLGPPNYAQFLTMIHPEDRPRMKELLETDHRQGVTYENELRIEGSNKEYRWFHAIFHQSLKDKANILKGVAIDITERKKAEIEIESLHQQVIQSARYAGMADIATSTLHNIGNVLNSAKVSIEIVKEYIARSEFKKFDKLEVLLEEHQSNLSEYFCEDTQGKLIPEYLIALIQNIKNEYVLVSQEINNISANMAHINDIITTQNDMSRPTELLEKVFLPQVIDEALRMAGTSFEKYNIQIEKKYEKVPFVLIDKIKLLQILINLIRNAKDALIENQKNDEKIVRIYLEEDKSTKNLIIKMRDNGIGILPENLTKIFSSGFTTKEKGHGLGLHMSALNANDLGGTLTAESKGIGKGATLTLIFPKVEAKELPK